MNFDFSDDQKLLKDQARKFLAEKCPPKAVRAVLEGDAGHDRALWQAIAEMGWLGTAIPENYGGLGLGYLELCVVAEELGNGRRHRRKAISPTAIPGRRGVVAILSISSGLLIKNYFKIAGRRPLVK